MGQIKWRLSVIPHEIFIVNAMLCRAVGPRSAPHIFIVHAFACSGTDFLPVFETRLVQDFRLVAVNLPGFGGSPGQMKCRTVAEHASALAELVKHVCGSTKVGFVAHSLGSMIAVEAIRTLDDQSLGLFSVEGNLTADDAYFSGKAADYTDATTFKRCFLEHLWRLGDTSSIFRSYHANAMIAEAEAMWHLGCDARRLCVDDSPGLAYRSIRPPSLYYWNVENVPQRTVDWIKSSGIPNLTFSGASHWPMIDIPSDTGNAIRRFFTDRAK